MHVTKTGLALVVLFLFCVPASSRSSNGGFVARAPSVNQPGHREWAWDGTDSFGIEVPATVHYVQGGAPRIVITGPDDMLAQVAVGQGQIRCADDACQFNHGKLDVTVGGMALCGIAISGSAQVLLGRLNQDELHLAISGSGSASAEGHVDHLELAIAGSGQADLGQLAVRSADVHVSGSGGATLAPREDANIMVSGSGGVKLMSRPARLHQMVSGSGRIAVSDRTGN
jgi:putative autotransporter adhesin-like protein